MAHGKADVAETLAEGSRQIAQFNWERAHRLYADALESSEAGSVPWQEAAFGAATALQHKSPASAEAMAEAGRLFEQLVDPKLNSRFAARSLIGLGRLAELRDYYGDRIDLPGARAHYAAVIERFPNDEVAAEASLRLASAFVQSYKPDDVKAGIAVLERYLSGHPNGPLASAMWQYLGDTYFYPLADDRKALDAYVKADRLGWLDDSDIGRVWWRMAQLGERIGDRSAAVEFYTKIVTDAAVSGKGYESQVALKRLGAPVPQIGLTAPAPARPTTVPAAAPATNPAGGRNG